VWRHLRAAFVLFHLAVIFVLAFPAPVGGMNRAEWKHPAVQEDFAAWARLLHVSTSVLEDTVYAVAVSFMKGRNAVTEPLAPYVRWTGCEQPWRMFVGPVRNVARLQVQIRVRGAPPDVWETLFEEHSPEHRWHAAMFDAERLRTQISRWPWPAYQNMFDQGCRYLSKRAFLERADAEQLRCRFWFARSPTPAEALSHNEPAGGWAEPRVYDRPKP
jgi:hypothetical protein